MDSAAARSIDSLHLLLNLLVIHSDNCFAALSSAGFACLLLCAAGFVKTSLFATPGELWLDETSEVTEFTADSWDIAQICHVWLSLDGGGLSTS